MKTLELFRDYNIPHQTDGHKHCRPGWVNVSCPFCVGNPGLHLGFKLDGSIATCWRCGWHPVGKALAKLTGLSEPKVREIMTEYGGTPTGVQAKEVKRKVRAKAFKTPSGTTPLQARHKRYILKRGFSPSYLEREWGLLGTGPVSKLDNINYSHRILAPIHWDGETVSFQTRDITGKHPVKYMACPEDRELIKHKHILYGRQDRWKKTGICVEGITDVWRLGFTAFATFGIKFTNKQIRAISKHFDRVIILFDDENQAQQQAQTLAGELKFRGVEAIIQTIDGDPGGLDQKIANDLVKKIYKPFV